jgi:hypothetical protein
VTVRVTDNGVPVRDDFETITVTVNEVNQAPVLGAIGNRSVDEMAELTFTATATDPDVPANDLGFSLDTGAPAGASITAGGVFSWIPTEGQGPGTFPVTVRVTDNGTPARDEVETISITVNEVNNLPIAEDDSAETSSPASGNVLVNDYQGDAPATVIGHTAPANGSVTMDAAGNFTYTPNTGFTGIDTFTYTIADSSGPETSTATVTITVNPVVVEPELVFADSFETGLGNWTQDQNDWFTRDRRATDGVLSAEVDGRASDAELVSPAIDVAGKTEATVTFSWYIESGLDTGEYLAFDVSVDGGPWQEKASLRGNVDPESTMHDVSIPVDTTGAATLRLRFRARMSRSGEDANLDNVIVMAGGSGPIPVTPPSAEFGYAPANPEQGQEVIFTDTSSAGSVPIKSWAWTFGDGGVSTERNPMHVYAAAGTFEIGLTVTDENGATGVATQSIVVRVPGSDVIVFADSFETGLGNWTQDQNDWFTRDRRATDGILSAEVDGRASDAELVSPVIDMAGKTKATVTFSWYIESGLDTGEYLAFDVSINGGPWQEKASLRGNVDPESTMHDVSIPVDTTGAATIRLRFRARMSRSGEDANLDNVVVTASSN